jgi:hypothetical protein
MNSVARVTGVMYVRCNSGLGHSRKSLNWDYSGMTGSPAGGQPQRTSTGPRGPPPGQGPAGAPANRAGVKSSGTGLLPVKILSVMGVSC